MIPIRSTPRSVTTAPAAEAVPPLEQGDHLDQETFHARYEAMPRGMRAELVQGVVFMPSPLRAEHGDTHGELITWLKLYKAQTPGTRVLDNTSTILGEDDELQPDASLLVLPERGGQTTERGGYLHGAPELVAEVASSSVAYDLHSKRQSYERAGVREYLVVVLREPQVIWFVRGEQGFTSQPAGADGLFRSASFPGLWLDPQALLGNDTARLVEGLQRGLASPEHARFVEELRARSV